MDQATWASLPNEIISMIVQQCDAPTLQNLATVDRHMHEHASRELRLRLQMANFQLYDTDEARIADVLHGRKDPHPFPQLPDDVVTDVINKGQVDAFRLFLSWGLNIRMYNSLGHSIMGVVFEANHDAIADYLVDNGHLTAEDVTTPILSVHVGPSLLDAAVDGGKGRAVNHFIDLVGDGIAEEFDEGLIVTACKTLPATTLKRLMAINVQLMDGNQASLRNSLWNRDTGAFDILLELTPQPTLYVRDHFGETILFAAQNAKNLYAMEKLLILGVDPNVTNWIFQNALGLACLYLDLEQVTLLLRYNARPRVGNFFVRDSTFHMFAEGLWRNREDLVNSFRYAEAQEIYDVLIRAGAAGESGGGRGFTFGEMFRLRCSIGYLELEEYEDLFS
ncbi:hypothetical protein BDV59DRAFT_204951 [Aspergillus ambiguus]|uniref:ankyrin repeat protein n=1 Tax=Aspergillus ambiguus TaxID=176160 RepID=UPI003CCDCD27